MFNLVGDDSPAYPACLVETSPSGLRVVGELTATAERRELRCLMVQRQWNELTGHALPASFHDTGINRHCSAGGKLQQNGSVEWFNDRLPDGERMRSP